MVGYGLTETSPIITLAEPRQVLTDSEPPERRQERLSMTGWAIPGVQIRVVEADGVDVRPDGEQIGEIVVRGNTVMDGYYRDPEATQETIRDGWLHTGDMATIDEAGYVMIKDRSKDIIISAGENISSVEIEVVIGAHPGVLENAVVAAPDDKRGEVPVAVVVLKPDAEVTAKETPSLVPRAPGRPQGAARGPFPRRAAQGRHGQDPQGRAARAVLGRAGVAGPLTTACQVPLEFAILPQVQPSPRTVLRRPPTSILPATCCARRISSTRATRRRSTSAIWLARPGCRAPISAPSSAGPSGSRPTSTC